jgi:hypothetical protein
MGRPGLSAHPKFRRLAVRLAQSTITARGALELLWDAAYDALDARLGTAAEIAFILSVDEATAARLIAALVAVGFLEADEAGDLHVHDLWDHCPEYVLQRCKAQGERLATRRSQAGHWRIPSQYKEQKKEQRAARESHPVEKSVESVEKSRPPSVLLRAGFATRDALPDDATEMDLKEELKQTLAQARLPFDGEMINRVLDVVTRIKPLQASLEARPPARRRRA